MEKAEIIAGLRSALSRGYNLDFAKKSFINAGYNLNDVEDSARSLVSSGFSQNSKPVYVDSTPRAPPIQQVQPVVGQRQVQQPVVSSPPAARLTPQTQPQVQSQPQTFPTQPQHPVESTFKSLPRFNPADSGYKRVTDMYGRPKSRGLLLVIILTIIFFAALGVLGMLVFNRPFVESLLSSWGLI